MTLPSARKVSFEVAKNTKTLSHVNTLLHMTFGQILDHDLDKTANTQVEVGKKSYFLVSYLNQNRKKTPKRSLFFLLILLVTY